MDHFKVYDSPPSSPTARSSGIAKRAVANRPKSEAKAKANANANAENGEGSGPQAPANLVKIPNQVRKLTDAQIRAKIAAHQEGRPSIAATPAPAPDDSSSGNAHSAPEVEMPHSDLAKNDPKDPVTQQKLRSLISNGGFNFSQDERKVLENILGTTP